MCLIDDDIACTQYFQKEIVLRGKKTCKIEVRVRRCMVNTNIIENKSANSNFSGVFGLEVNRFLTCTI